MTLKSLESLRRELGQAAKFKPVHGKVATYLGLSGHIQTLLGHFLPSKRLRTERPERVELALPDGDTLIGFILRPLDKKEIGVLHIFHGLAGSSDSAYMPRAANSALELGFAVVLWNHRGCGPGRGRALEPYHSGRSDDLARTVKWGRTYFSSSDNDENYVHGILGYSLSANATCLLAAHIVPAIDSAPLSEKYFDKTLNGAWPDFAIAINPPLNLKAAADRLSRGPSRIYGQSFMGPLLESLDDRIQWSPENEKRRVFRNLASSARKRLTRITDVGTFDAAYTGPAGGFRDNFDYYERAAAGQFLEQVKIPLVILSADDDPITHGLSGLPAASPEKFANPNVVIDSQKQGGHMGYVDHATLKSVLIPSKKTTNRWLEARIQLYLKAFIPTAVKAMVFFVLMASLPACSLVDAWKSGAGPSENLYKEGRLAECPTEPNCVSTQATRPDHLIVPFTYSKPIAEAREALKKEMSRVPRSVMVKEDGAYLHFECRSPVLRLTDDIEFYFDDETKTLQFRSGSRFGYSDWGINRKRMEDIRNKILGHI